MHPLARTRNPRQCHRRQTKHVVVAGRDVLKIVRVHEAENGYPRRLEVVQNFRTGASHVWRRSCVCCLRLAFVCNINEQRKQNQTHKSAKVRAQTKAQANSF